MDSPLPAFNASRLPGHAPVCEPFNGFSNSMEFRHKQDLDKLTFIPVVMQIIFVNVFKLSFQLLLKPFGHQTFVPQILGSIAVSSPFLGKYFHEKILLGPKSLLVVNVFEALGIMFLLFLLSVRVDISIMEKCGRLAVIIGIASFLVPLGITLMISFFVSQIVSLNEELGDTLPVLSLFISTTSFHVIFALLTDLKLLNSELGRLALSSSMISGLSSWAFYIVCYNAREVVRLGIKPMDIVYTQICNILIVLFILFIFRPLMYWMVRQTPDGKPLRETHVCAIIVMVLVSSFLGEYTGQHFYFGPVVLGLAAPPGPELASSLIEKIDCFVEAVLMPCYIIDIGRRFNLYFVSLNSFIAMELLIFACFLSKLAAIIVPSLYYRMPFVDALSLGLILNCKGFLDVQIYVGAHEIEVLSTEVFSILVMTATLHSAVFTSCVRYIYNPSRRYVAYRRRTIQHTEPNSELRILACIYQQDDVHPVVNILSASNPSRESPIAVYILNLKELAGGTLPILITHKLNRTSSTKSKETDRIVNAFHQFEQQNFSLVSVQCFTCVGAYDTMHDDICTMALDKITSLIIIPYRRGDSSSVRLVNKKVLEKASCSVGILIARGKMARYIVPYQLLINVCVVFIGGPDDREVLAYGARMAMLPGVKLTVLRLLAEEHDSFDLIEKKNDLNMISNFRYANMERNVEYRDELVTQGAETAKVLGAVCNNFDLIIVGRRHNPDSPILRGLSDWSEIDELGIVGDLLAASDLNCQATVLVVQQQASVVEGMMD